MEYLRSGKSYRNNIGFRLEYERISDGEKIGVDLEVYPIQPSENYEWKIEIPDTVKKSESGEGYRLVFDFNQLDDAWIEIRNLAHPDPSASVKLDIPEPRIFVICEAILNGRGFYGHEEWLKENLASEREGYYLVKFRARSEKILKFKDHVRILSFISEQHPRVGKVVAENLPGYFRKRILQGAEPHSITSFSDLKYKIDIVNKHDFLPSIDYNDILRDSLLEIYTRQRNSGYSYNEHLLNRILPEGKADLEYIYREICGLYLASLIQGEQLGTANELFSDWEENARSPEGEYSEKIQNIEAQLSEGSSELSDFAEYLYYVGRSEISEGLGRGTLPLFEASYQNSSGSSQLEEYAEFWLRMREGQRQIHEGDGEAREAFDEALTVIDSLGQNNEKLQNWRKEALSGKYRAIVNDYETESGAETAIQYLTHFLNDDLTNLDSDSELRLQVEALRHDLISKENIRNSAVELAKENLSEATKLYSKADLPRSRARVHARKKQLEAFLDEINLEFDEAAEKYGEISEIYDKALGESGQATRFEDIGHLCASKSELLDEQPRDAVDTLELCSGFDDAVSSEASALAGVSEQLQNYQDGVISSKFESSENIVATRVDGLLSAEFDLNETKFVIYAAQFLRRYGFSSDLLDSMIDIALKESFAPTPIETELEYEDPVNEREKDLLLNISLDEVWQSKLPTHIHYQIEQLKIQEIHIAGDYSSLLKELTTTLEVFLAVVGEYYSNIVHGEIHDDISPIDDASLGTLIEFVQGLPREDFPISKELGEEFSSEDLPKNRNISETRNAGSHGSELRTSESHYEETKEKLINIFRIIAPHSPVIVEIEDENAAGQCVGILHWGGLKRRIWLTTNATLDVGELYYLPPEELENNRIVEVPSSLIIQCQADRARNVTSIAEEH